MMTKKEKIHFIEAIFDALFPHPVIPLVHYDPYTLLIATLLSAQCTDAKVNKVTPQLFALASNPFEMAKHSAEEIEAIIKPLGLSKAKAKAIVELSKILVTKYKGEVPKSFQALEELPGVGHKTASVVMVQAFDHPAFPVDTHIHRCAAKWGLASGKSVEATEKSLKRLFPKKSWGKRHLQMIYYARAYCPARGHSLDKCLICAKFS